MRKVYCFIPECFADFEVVFALHLLRNLGGKEIVTLGYTRDWITAQSGLGYQADKLVGDIESMDDCDGIIFPGGPIREQKPELTSFIKRAERQKKMLAAICFAPQYLARSGVLENRRFTTSCTADYIRSLNMADPFPRERFLDQRVVVDGHVITAQGHAFVEFAYVIMEYLSLFSDKEDELYTLYRNITGNEYRHLIARPSL